MQSTETTYSAEGAATPSSPSVIFKPDNWFKPLDWRAVFPREQPVEIDLGCGKGSFLLWAARVYPQRNCLGVERLLRRLRRVDRKAVRDGLENVRLIRVEATYLISKLIPDSTVSTYHILFPDPWPKRRHHSRRLINGPFLADVHRTLIADGLVNCATDHEEYFQWIDREFQKTGRFEKTEPAVLPTEAWTDFERDFILAGKPVYRSRWQRR
jgi:tRNA (guanine-N7-)-methyltransferase